MSDVPDILHEDDVREVIQDEIDKADLLLEPTGDPLSVVPDAAGTYSQSDTQILINVLNGLITKLAALNLVEVDV